MVTDAGVVGRYSCRTGGCTAGPTLGVQSLFVHQSLLGSFGVPCVVIFATVEVVVFHRGVSCRVICFHFDPPAVVGFVSAVFCTVNSFVDPRAALAAVVFRVRTYDVVTGFVLAGSHAAYVLVF